MTWLCCIFLVYEKCIQHENNTALVYVFIKFIYTNTTYIFCPKSQTIVSRESPPKDRHNSFGIFMWIFMFTSVVFWPNLGKNSENWKNQSTIVSFH